ncbi:hypothetical protein DL765_009435 [Monosporascus sp. GIB2]|nr:hypothetical protein DL765_009435 [Monosporascus sp. GIB2]
MTTADAPPLDITWAVLALSTLGATAFYSAVHKDFGNFLSLGMAVTNVGYLFEALVFQETDAAPSRMLTCAALWRWASLDLAVSSSIASSQAGPPFTGLMAKLIVPGVTSAAIFSKFLRTLAELVPEQDQQVPLMGEIYKREIRTVIRLGAGLPGDAGTPSHASAVVSRLFHVRDSVRPAGAVGVGEELGGQAARSSSSPKAAVFIVGDATCDAALLYTYLASGEALLLGDTHEQRLFRTRNSLLEALNPDLASSDSDPASQ